MISVKDFLRERRPIAVLAVLILVLTTLPAINIALVLGSNYQGIPPSFDDIFYLARVQSVVEGSYTIGNPYFYEHRNDAPLVVLAGIWLSALPGLIGVPLLLSLFLNFILWSFVFALVLYWLFRELRAPPWLAVLATVVLFLGSYEHVWRSVNLQTVFPFYFLFYVALLRFIRVQSRTNIWMLAGATGASFYFYPYLWQMAGLTLALFILFGLVRKNWQFTKAALKASILGGIIGLPIPLYILWLSHTSPYFWESMGRLGLVHTHLPMAEIVYSGGWIGVMLIFVALLYWRVKVLRDDLDFVRSAEFIAISGLGMWLMEGSNLITGMLLETGEHVRLFIFPWLALASIAVALLLYKHRAQISGTVKVLSAIALLILAIPPAHFFYGQLAPHLPAQVSQRQLGWEQQQSFAKPFAWLTENEKHSVVVWSDSRAPFSNNLPIFTKHYTLYTYFGMLELVPEGEIRERYLISQYFDNPSVTDLMSDTKMGQYLGRRDLPHQAKTIERKIKICRILFSWDKHKECGTPSTPRSLLGVQFFVDLEKRFHDDIKPNIKVYLEKYHVSYILKDTAVDTQYRPQTLGAILVYSDDRYEIWKL